MVKVISARFLHYKITVVINKNLVGRYIETIYCFSWGFHLLVLVSIDDFYTSYYYEPIIVLCCVTQLCPILCNPMDYSPPGCSVHGDSPGKNTRVGCHALLQGIFLTQGLNSGLPHWRRIHYHLGHQGSPNQLLILSQLLLLRQLLLW